ncbi:hypothetical protein ABF176_002599 [Flavobacterium psychrophilum]
MNIYAIEGHKIKCVRLSAGYRFHQELAEKYLEVEKEYTVEKTDVDSYHTDVYLKEIPNINFNSVFFEDVEKQSKDDDKKHFQYRM